MQVVEQQRLRCDASLSWSGGLAPTEHGGQMLPSRYRMNEFPRSVRSSPGASERARRPQCCVLHTWGSIPCNHHRLLRTARWPFSFLFSSCVHKYMCVPVTMPRQASALQAAEASCIACREISELLCVVQKSLLVVSYGSE